MITPRTDVILKWVQGPSALWFCPQTRKELAQRNSLHVEHFERIDDYLLHNPAPLYRAFITLRRLFGLLLPRLPAKNAMLRERRQRVVRDMPQSQATVATTW